MKFAKAPINCAYSAKEGEIIIIFELGDEEMAVDVLEMMLDSYELSQYAQVYIRDAIASLNLIKKQTEVIN